MLPDPELAKAYKLVLGGESPSHAALLGDLTMFCHVAASTIKTKPVDALDMARLEGRREVMLHIQAMIEVPLNVLTALAATQRLNERRQ